MGGSPFRLCRQAKQISSDMTFLNLVLGQANGGRGDVEIAQFATAKGEAGGMVSP